MGRFDRVMLLRAWRAALAFCFVLASAAPAASLPDVVARVKVSVVAVGTYQKTRSPAFQFRGTGFVIGNGVTVATNAHVLPESLDRDRFESLAVIAVGDDGQLREAQTIATDKDHDLALLRISGAALKPLDLAGTGSVREGQSVAFTGFPIGAALGLVPATHRATVSALTPIALPSANAQQLDPRVVRRLNSGAFRVMQLDGTAYPGNSGSPVYDAETGEVIGIVNMVYVKATRETVLSQPSGITFAIPADFVRELLEKTGDVPARPQGNASGISAAPVAPARDRTAPRGGTSSP